MPALSRNTENPCMLMHLVVWHAVGVFGSQLKPNESMLAPNVWFEMLS